MQSTSNRKAANDINLDSSYIVIGHPLAPHRFLVYVLMGANGLQSHG